MQIKYRYSIYLRPMEERKCPRCQSIKLVKSGVVKAKQRFMCKDCRYAFTVLKDGKNIDPYYVIKALQLHIEGVSLREIERLIGVSHVSVMNWIKKYKVQAPETQKYKPSYKVFKHAELINHLQNPENMKDKGMIITEIGDKFMLIHWDKFQR
jgi:transposase-like protein